MKNLITGFVVFPKYRAEGKTKSIAYYHPPESLTWRWSLSWQWRFWPDWTWPRHWVQVARHKYPNGGGTLYLCFGPIGFQFSWQERRRHEGN